MPDYTDEFATEDFADNCVILKLTRTNGEITVEANSMVAPALVDNEEIRASLVRTVTRIWKRRTS